MLVQLVCFLIFEMRTDSSICSEACHPRTDTDCPCPQQYTLQSLKQPWALKHFFSRCQNMKTKCSLPYRRKKLLDGKNTTQKNVLVSQLEGNALEKPVTRVPVDMMQFSPSWTFSTSSNICILHMMGMDSQRGRSVCCQLTCLISNCIHMALCKLTGETPKASFTLTVFTHFKLKIFCSVCIIQ